MTGQEARDKTCNCAPDIDGLIVHNSWAHQQEARDDERGEPCSEECGWCGQNAPARDDEREAQGWAEAEAYADDSDPSKRMETMDDFMTGWRTADRTRKHPEPEITHEMVRRAALSLYRSGSPVSWSLPDDWEGAMFLGRARAALEAAFRVPVGEGETDGAR